MSDRARARVSRGAEITRRAALSARDFSTELERILCNIERFVENEIIFFNE